MRAFLLGMVLVAGAAQPPAEAAAQARLSRNCSDDSGVDRCATEQQQRVRDLFGVPPIEELHAAGAQVRRAFYVDGYGRDLIALSFVRAPGRDPTLTVHWPRNSDLPAREPAQALLAQPVWEEVLTRSQYFDRDLAPRTADPNNPVICLHSWVYTVEAADPPRGRGYPGAVRRKVQDACGDGLAQPYATELARIALAAVPFCAALDRQLHRNEASMLHACAMLEGDRLAAAEGFNQALRLARVDRQDDSLRAREIFQYRGALEWEGQTFAGDRGEAVAAWIERMIGEDTPNFYIRRVVGESAPRVRVEGQMSRTLRAPGAQAVNQAAPVTLLLESHPNDPGLRVERATVGSFATVQR